MLPDAAKYFGKCRILTHFFFDTLYVEFAEVRQEILNRSRRKDFLNRDRLIAFVNLQNDLPQLFAFAVLWQFVNFV
jgi:hypothetical protein